MPDQKPTLEYTRPGRRWGRDGILNVALGSMFILFVIVGACWFAALIFGWIAAVPVQR